jgi:eukaryotic-like serine/threonine-protein kinase
MANTGKRLYEFGPFRIDPDHRLLLREDQPVPVQPKAFDILLVLVQNSEKVVLKDDLLKAVWPDTFVEESNLAQNIFVLRKTLGDAVGKNQYIVTVPGRGYRFAERVTEIPPVSESLVVETQKIQKVTIEERSRPLRGSLWALAAVLLMLGGMIAYRSFRAPRVAMTAPAAGLPSRRSVAVLGFRDLSGRPEDAWLSTALAEMLNTELAVGDKLRLIPSEDVARTKLDLRLPDADSFSKDTLARVHKRLGSDVIVLGSYASLGGKSSGSIRVDLRVQDAVAGETIAEVATTGTEDGLFDVASRAGVQLREKLGLAAVSPEDAVRVKTALPSNPEAARLYAAGLAKLRIFETLAARDLLEGSVAADPKYPLSRAALAAAWASLGYDKKANDEAKQAHQLAGSLSRTDQLEVEGGYRLTNHEYDKAIEAYRTLFTLFPDNPDYGLRLAAAQAAGSKQADVLTTVAELRKLPSPASDDPRIDLQEAAGWITLAKYQQALAPLQHALEKGRAQGDRLLVAHALERQCRALAYIGQANAVTSCREARDTYAAAGDQAGEAQTLRSWADAIEESDAASAIDLDRKAAEIFRSIGSEGGVAGALNTLGLLYTDQGDLAAAERAHLESRALFQKLGDKTNMGVVISNLANERMLQGDLLGATKLYEEAMAMNRESGDPGSAAVALYNKANLQELRGDLAGAKQGFQEALKDFQAGGNSYDAGYALYSIGEVLLKEGDFAGARHALDASLKIRNDSGEKVLLAETQMLQIEVSLEEGKSGPDAETTVRQTMNVFEKEKALDDQAEAWDLLARVLYAEQKGNEAMHAAEQALAFSQKSRNFEVRMDNAITATRMHVLNIAGDKRALQNEAAKQLATVASEARKRGYVEVEMEARLAAAEVEKSTGLTGVAETHLSALESEARAKGFGLIAQKAAAVRAS